jgi:hypothetical protein
VSDARADFVQRRMAAVGGDGFDAIGGNFDLVVDDCVGHSVNYLLVVLGVKLPPLD